jgi:hypothetical protein
MRDRINRLSSSKQAQQKESSLNSRKPSSSPSRHPLAQLADRLGNQAMNRFWAGRSWPDIRRVLHAERGDLTFGAPSPSGGLPAPAAHLGNRETLQLVRRMRNSDDARDPLEQEADAAAARAAATGAAGALDGLVGTVVRDDPASRAAVDAAGARAVTLHGEI